MFYSDETLLKSHKTSALSLLAVSAKLTIFNVMKLSIKFLLKLALINLDKRLFTVCVVPICRASSSVQQLVMSVLWAPALPSRGPF